MLCRNRNKYFFHNLKYEDFSKLFLRCYGKGYHGVNATYHEIQVEHPNITMPSLRQVFDLINNLKWIIKPFYFVKFYVLVYMKVIFLTKIIILKLLINYKNVIIRASKEDS